MHWGVSKNFSFFGNSKFQDDKNVIPLDSHITGK